MDLEYNFDESHSDDSGGIRLVPKMEYKQQSSVILGSPNRRCWLLRAALYLLVMILVVPAVGQDETSDDLPRYAAWRIGKYGEQSDQNGYYFLKVSPNGRYFAARNHANTLEIYRTSDQRKLCEIEGPDWKIQKVDFSPDSKYFVTTAPGAENNVKVWETESGTRVTTLEGEFETAVFSLDGKQIVALTESEVRRYKWPEGTQLTNTKWTVGSEIGKTVSRDGELIAAFRSIGQPQYRCHLINMETGANTHLDGPTALPMTMAISNNNKWLAVRYQRSVEVGIWDLSNLGQAPRSLMGHSRAIQSIAFSPDNRFLISTSWDQTAVVWDLLTLQKIGTLRGHDGRIMSCAFFGNSLKAVTGASGEDDSSIIAWDLEPLFFPRKPRKLKRGQFESAWEKLADNSPDNALRAVSDIRNSWDQMESWVVEQIGALKSGVDEQKIAGWIEQLDSKSFAEREQATAQLIALRRAAEPLLKKTLDETTSGEVRYRVTKILRTEVGRIPMDANELRRLHRSVFLLELIGDDTACEILRSISLYHRHPEIAEDARLSLERLERRRSDNETTR